MPQSQEGSVSRGPLDVTKLGGAQSFFILQRFLLQSQLDMDDEALVLLTRQVKYNSLVYVVPWLSASIGADAPYNDLKLYKTLLEFSNIDPPVAEVAIKFLNNHLWYLTQVNILV